MDSYPKAKGGRPCTMTTEAKPRTKVTSEAKPFVTVAKRPPDTYQPASWPLIWQKCPHLCSPYPTLTNHLMLPSQQEFSCPWVYKDWLLTDEKCQFTLACQEVSPLCSQHPHYLCSLILIDSLLSAILCVWKVFPNLCLDCHDSLYIFKYVDFIYRCQSVC